MVRAFQFLCCMNLLLIVSPSWGWLPTLGELEELLKKSNSEAQGLIQQILAEPDSRLIPWLQERIHPLGTPLHICVVRGNLELFQRLSERCNNLESIPNNIFGTTLLHCAADSNHLHVVKYLLEQGALLVKNRAGCTPLYYAAIRGFGEVVEHLMDNAFAGPLASDYCSIVINPLVRKFPDIVEYLLNHSAAAAAVFDEQKTPLHRVVELDSRDIVQGMLNHGVLVTTVNRSGQTALHRAVSRGCLPVVECLLAHGALVTARDSYNQTPLHFAVGLPMVKCLLAHGALVSARDLGNWTPLHYAIWNNRLQVVPCLFAHMSLTSMNYGAIHLFFLTRNNRQTLIRCLLTNEASEAMTGEGSNGETPFAVSMRLALVTKASSILPPPDISLTPPSLLRIASYTIWRAVGDVNRLRALFKNFLPSWLLRIVMAELMFQSDQSE